MPKLALSLLLICMVAWISASAPAQGAVVEVVGQGSAPGETTTYTCTQFPEFPPDCPSQTVKGSWNYFIDEMVSTDALKSGPVHFSEQIGQAYFESFSIALVGTDRWGNDVFQGQDLQISGVDNPHACLGFDYPCEMSSIDYAATTFPLRQIAPPPVPEPATWILMLLGFGSVGFIFRKRRRLFPLPRLA